MTIVEAENPAAPGLNDPHTCGTARAVCAENRLTFDVIHRTRIRAVATTGEVFEGAVSPTWTDSPRRDGACECAGSVATVEVTLTPP